MAVVPTAPRTNKASAKTWQTLLFVVIILIAFARIIGGIFYAYYISYIRLDIDAIKKDKKRGLKFSNDNRTLTYAPYITEYKIPKGVKSIGSSAFSRCKCLKSIKLPERFRGKTFLMKIPDDCTVIFY